MRCLSVLLRLDQLRTGEIGPEESARVREHLAECETCGDTFIEIERFARQSHHAVPRASRSLLDSFDQITVGDTLLWVALSRRGLRMIGRAIDEERFRDQYAETFGRCLRRDPLPLELRQQIIDAVEGKGARNAPVDLSGLRPFEQRVLVACSAIPHGEVRSYSWIARSIGQPRATRAVGNALNRNPLAPVIPCHRVVPASGGVGNYALGRLKKIELLQREGADLRLLDELARTRGRLFGMHGLYCEPACARLRDARAGEAVPLRDEREATERGFQPCPRCAPALLTA
jgi:methylated-DNA-[protein]-cysteine S-methyltransferase